MRNEAHRFGITHHRGKRRKANLSKSELHQIKGIGPKTQFALIKQFKSVKRIKASSLEEIEKVIGKAKAAIVFETLKKN